MLARTSGREHCSVHIRREFCSQIEENTAVCDLQLNYVSCIIQKFWHQLDLLHQMHHFIIRVISLLPFVTLQNNKIENEEILTLSKPEEPIRGRHRFASKLRTLTSPWTPNSAVHRSRVKQRESRGKPEVATVSLARGVFRGARHTKTETEREQSNGGEFPKTLTPSASIDITHTLELEHKLSRSLAQHFLFETFCASN